MKQLLRQIFCLTLILCPMGLFGDSCSSSSSDKCSSSYSSKCSSSSSSCSVSSSCSESSSSCSSSSSSSSCSRKECGDGFARRGLHYRSQADNLARVITGWQWAIDRADMCENYGSFYAAYEYQRTFNGKKLARAYFGDDQLRFAGSQVVNRAANELIADNFGLSTTFRGAINLRPRIQNHIVDLGLYLGFDSCVPGLYLRVQMPIVHTKWSLGCCKPAKCENSCTASGTAEFDSCYVSSTPNPATGATTLPITTTNDDFSDAVLGVPAATSIQQALSGNFLFGDMQTPWKAGKFDCSKNCNTRNGVAALDFNLGYNVLLDDCYHLGGFLRVVAPTGPKQRDEFVFSPVVGNGRFWEFGGGLSAHAVLYSGERSNLALFFLGNVTHMFKSKQCRLFDFCGKPNSRYALLKQFASNGLNLSYSNLINAASVNNRRANVSISVKGDALVKLAYRYCGFGADLGYEVYGTTHEKIRLRDCESRNNCSNQNFYGIKGTSGVCAFGFPVGVIDGVNNVLPAGTVIDADITAPSGCPALVVGSSTVMTTQFDNSTQPNANMYTVVRPTTTPVASTACNVLLSSTSDTITSITPIDEINPNNGFVLAGPQSPVLVGDLDPRSAEAPSVLTHKVFGYLNYTFMDECGWDPEIGVGGEVEFDGLHKDHHRRHGKESNNNDRHNRRHGCGLYQWGAWVKGSINF